MLFSSHKEASCYWYDEGLDLDYGRGAKVQPHGHRFILVCVENGTLVPFGG
jgi:hypothetical protein